MKESDVTLAHEGIHILQYTHRHEHRHTGSAVSLEGHSTLCNVWSVDSKTKQSSEATKTCLSDTYPHPVFILHNSISLFNYIRQLIKERKVRGLPV